MSWGEWSCDFSQVGFRSLGLVSKACMGGTWGVLPDSCFPPSKAGKASLILCELMAGRPVPGRQCGRVSGMQRTAEWLGPGRHGQQGGQSHQLWTVGSAPEAGTRSRFPSQVRGTPQTVGIQGSSSGLLTSRKPQEALERIQGGFPLLCALSFPLCSRVWEASPVMVRGNLSSPLSIS